MLPLKTILSSLTLILGLSEAVVAIAVPAADNTTPALSEVEAGPLLEKRSCPSKKRMYSWNAGCSSDWAGRCYDECIRQAPGKKCCQFVSSLIADKCGWVSKNCYCDCYIPA